MAAFLIKLMKVGDQEDEVFAEGWIGQEEPEFLNGFIVIYKSGKSSLHRSYYSNELFDYMNITPAFDEVEVKNV